MPHAAVGGINLYYETHGEGPPLVLIHGLGFPATLWYQQVPAFARDYQVILLDNRGAGRSDQPREGYSVERMAADVAELLDYLQIERAHVLGLSLGGYIAQEFALTHLTRVRGLILACTQAGGPEYLKATGPMWKERLDVAGLTQEEIYRHGVEWGTTEAFRRARPDVVDEVVRLRTELPQTGHGFGGQFSAGSKFDARERFPRITAPTLVLHGTEDEVVPPAFAEDLAQRIPSARLQWIPNTGHLPFIEDPEAFNRAVLDFLSQITDEGVGI